MHVAGLGVGQGAGWRQVFAINCFVVVSDFEGAVGKFFVVVVFIIKCCSVHSDLLNWPSKVNLISVL